ncbi:MAG TPA: hypothetical protein VER58_13130 [Thermoanaerobaculia bacterium]|nr:hypothetical protein [Thermoanaerobaculia bacterium]
MSTFLISYFRVALALFVIAGSALAQNFQPGDVVFASFVPSNATGFLPGFIDWYGADGSPRQRIASYSNDPAFALVFGSDSRLYATRVSELTSNINVFDITGGFAGNFGPHLDLARGIVRDRDGNFFVSGFNLYKLNPAGNLVGTFTNVRESMIDLASDQCTLYLVSQGTAVQRYDVCRNASLPDLTASLPGSTAHDLRILPDSSVLIADEEVIARVAANGTIMQTYSPAGLGGWRAVALALDGRSFWAAAVDVGLFHIRLSDGAVLTGPIPAVWTTSIGIVGEPRAAITPMAVPTLSSVALGALLLALAAVSLMRLQ